MPNRYKFRPWTRALASTAIVALGLTASNASAQCVSVLGIDISVDLLGNTCIAGGQTGPGTTGGLAIGGGATVLGPDGIAIGTGTIVNGPGGIALGDGSSSTGVNGIAIGAGTSVLGTNGIGLGLGALVGGLDGISLGNGSNATGFQGIAIGADALSLLEADLAIGRFARAGAPGDPFGSNTAFGDNALASGGFASAFGANSNAIGLRASSFGAGALATSPGSLALGADSRAITDGAVAIGRGSIAGAADLTAGTYAPVVTGPVTGIAFDNTAGVDAGSLSVGAAGAARQVRNVADGTAAGDAVNVRQLSGVVDQTNAALNGLDVRTTDNANAIAGLNGRVTTNAANIATNTGSIADLDGRVTANTGAIGALDGRLGTAETQIAANTGAIGALDGRLGAAESQIATNTGAIAANTGAITALDGRVTAGEQLAAANSGAIAGLDGRVATNEAGLAQVRQGLDEGTIGLVRQDPGTRALTVGAQTDGTVVSVAGTRGDRTVTGVANATTADAAVNGGQLAAVVAAFGPGATLNPDGSVTIPAYAVQGTSQTTVGGAIGALDGGLTTIRTQVDAINRTADGAYVAINGTGPVANATGTGSVAIGSGSTSTAADSVAIGSDSVASRGAQTGYAAPGLSTPQTSYGEVSMGAPGATRQVTNVAAGSAATDAVNVAQLQGGLSTTVRYDTGPSGTPNYNSVTLGNGSGAVGLHNVAPGVLGTDAVNVDQLRSLNFDMTRDIGRYRTEAQRGTAVALAATGMRFDDRPGRTSMGAAVSTFRGETGVAMGIGHTSSNQRLRYNAAVSFSPNGGSNVGAVAGATFSFGGD